MTKLLQDKSYTEARMEQFRKYVYDYKIIKRGVLTLKMNCSDTTFSHEYMNWLDCMPEIKYDKTTRQFMWIGQTPWKQESL